MSRKVIERGICKTCGRRYKVKECSGWSNEFGIQHPCASKEKFIPETNRDIYGKKCKCMVLATSARKRKWDILNRMRGKDDKNTIK